ncbi:hypothetical protein [Sediminibacterium sp. KACHI17]
MVTVNSKWYPSQKLVSTQISGNADLQDIIQWKLSLIETLNQIPDNSEFKIYVNLYGFKAVNFEVHKVFRDVIPGTLLNYGWRVGYLDMFPEVSVKTNTTRNIQCKAAAHIHQDESKIKKYDELYSCETERFFTDETVAKEWIDSFHL